MESKQDFSAWMAELPKPATTLPLRMLAMPGTHDSGAFSITKDSPEAPDMSAAIRKLKLVLGKGVQRIISGWSITQTLDMIQQLKAGVRYFDMRVCTHPDDKTKFYVCHALRGSQLDPLMVAVAKFSKENPKEVIVLDFNHLYEFAPESHDAFHKLICGTFGASLAVDSSVVDTPLCRLWDSKVRILAFYAHRAYKRRRGLLDPKLMHNPWPNKRSTSGLFPELEKILAEADRYVMNHMPPRLFSLQGICTPTEKSIIKGLVCKPRNLLQLASKVSPAVLDFLRTLRHPNDERAELRHPNDEPAELRRPNDERAELRHPNDERAEVRRPNDDRAEPVSPKATKGSPKPSAAADGDAANASGDTDEDCGCDDSDGDCDTDGATEDDMELKSEIFESIKRGQLSLHLDSVLVDRHQGSAPVSPLDTPVGDKLGRFARGDSLVPVTESSAAQAADLNSSDDSALRFASAMSSLPSASSAELDSLSPREPYTGCKYYSKGGPAYINIVMIDDFRATSELTQWCIEWNRKFR